MNDNVAYPRYEFIWVEYENSEYLGHLLKISYDEDAEYINPAAAEYLDEIMTFNVNDVASSLSEQLRWSNKKMTIEEYRKYVYTLSY